MRHSMFVYEDDEAMVGKMTTFLGDGLTDGESVVVVLEPRKWDLLSDALGSAAGTIRYLDRDSFYSRPEAALAGYDGTLRRFVRDGASAIRVFGEVPRCATDADCDAWISYEAILNRAFAHQPVWVMCGYDAREASGALLDGALETHPEALEDDMAPCPGYHEPADVVTAHTPPPMPLDGLHALPFDSETGSGRFRQALSAELEAAAVNGADADNMLIAAGEVLANARRHGGGAVTISVGRVGERFVCEVSDQGRGVRDPLAGYLPPRPGQSAGAGLWVARQLTRRLELMPSPNGSSVRLWI